MGRLMRVLGASGERIIDATKAMYCPEIREVLMRAAEDVPYLKRQIAAFQGAALYALAQQYNAPDAHVLEIGTAWGYSAALLSLAAPAADIVTLNPKDHEMDKAEQHLRDYGNVRLVRARSWDYLWDYDGPELDMVWVDGDHARIIRDLPWFNVLKVGGLMLFHDYAPPDSARPCSVVYHAINMFATLLGDVPEGRNPDVLVVDDQKVGMAGFYRREHEFWCGYAVDPWEDANVGRFLPPTIPDSPGGGENRGGLPD